MASKSKMKKLTILTAIISFVSFAYKLGMGLYTMSIMLMISALSTFLLFICKVLFIRNVTMTRDKKKRAYLFMTCCIFLFSLIFIAFVVLKIADIDISKKNTFEGYLGIAFIAFTFLMFVLSIIGLKGALDKTDLMVKGLKEMTFVSALGDFLLIEDFAYRTVTNYYQYDWLDMINKYFPLGIGILMILVSIIMLIRGIRYQADTSKTK